MAAVRRHVPAQLPATVAAVAAARCHVQAQVPAAVAAVAAARRRAQAPAPQWVCWPSCVLSCGHCWGRWRGARHSCWRPGMRAAGVARLLLSMVSSKAAV